MNRDPMRIFAWVLVGLGVLVIVLTKFVVDAKYDAVLKYWSQHPLSLRPPAEPNYLGGWLTGAILAGLGVLLLAIRRPKPQSDPRPKR